MAKMKMGGKGHKEMNGITKPMLGGMKTIKNYAPMSKQMGKGRPTKGEQHDGSGTVSAHKVAGKNRSIQHQRAGASKKTKK